jgi:hypothetical protein
MLGLRKRLMKFAFALNEVNWKDLLLLLLLLLLLFVIFFMQGIYTYIPETNHVPRDYSVAAIL